MAANATKTVEYAFATSGSNIATGTTLAASTRYDFPWIGITIPEITSRTFKSVILEVYYRDAFTTVYNTSGWRLGGSFSNPSGSGSDVQVDAYRTYDNYWSGSALSTSSGSYTISVLDNVYPYFVSASQDVYHIGRSANAVAV